MRLAAAFETVDGSSADDVYVFGLESLSRREWTTLRRWKSVPGVFYSVHIADPVCKPQILQELVPLLLRTKSLAPEDDGKQEYMVPQTDPKRLEKLEALPAFQHISL